MFVTSTGFPTRPVAKGSNLDFFLRHELRHRQRSDTLPLTGDWTAPPAEEATALDETWLAAQALLPAGGVKAGQRRDRSIPVVLQRGRCAIMMIRPGSRASRLSFDPCEALISVGFSCARINVWRAPGVAEISHPSIFNEQSFPYESG